MSKFKSKKNSFPTVAKSRELIDKILIKWGVSGIQWEDNFDNGSSVLRFRWRPKHGDKELVARFNVSIESESDLMELSVDHRSGKFSEKKYNRMKNLQGRKEHKILLSFLHNAFEAINMDIIKAEALLMPWLEDATGKTIYEKIEPVLGKLAGSSLSKALSESDA